MLAGTAACIGLPFEVSSLSLREDQALMETIPCEAATLCHRCIIII